MIYDVRTDTHEDITQIIFADDKFDGFYLQANRLLKESNFIEVYDESNDFLRVSSKEHAQNLIKALEKAIDLGWLE